MPAATTLAELPNVTPTVFIVDDDPAVRSAISLLVRTCGWKARPCASAAEFLETYDERSPACVLLDLRMPGMDGLELQRRIADMDPVPPVIVVTAWGDRDLADRARAGGARAVVTKPFRGDDLLARIHEALADQE